MSSFEDWARSNKETLLKFGKSRSNAQRELKKILTDEQFASAKKWFKQLGKSKSYTAALHELWGDANTVEDDGEHTDVSELALEHANTADVKETFDSMVDIVDRQDSDAAFRMLTSDPELLNLSKPDAKPFDIVASLKQKINEMDANKPVSIYEKLRRIVEK